MAQGKPSNDMSKWYIVKSNWSQVDQLIHASSGVEEFAGVGGNIWPLDTIDSGVARKMQSRYDKGRCYLDIGESQCMHVITDCELAVEYYELVRGEGLNPLLLELSIAGADETVDGFDFGNPEGGFSIIETEILCRQNYSAINKYLNKHNGLFSSIEVMNDFLDSLDEGEQLDCYRAVGIKYLR
jgi:hypothetical protein